MSKRTLHSFFSPPSKRAKSGPDISTITRTISPPPTPKSNSDVDTTRTSSTSYSSNNNVFVKLESDTTDAAEPAEDEKNTYTTHPTYPFPIRDLPPSLSTNLESLLITALSTGKPVTNHPHLDLLYFQPLIPEPLANKLFRFLRSSLPFYRVCYNITRFGKETRINTPRFTTVFGVDETSRFELVSSTTSTTTSDPVTHNPHIDQSPATTTTTTTTRLTNPPPSSTPIPPKKYKCTPDATSQYPRPIPGPLQLLLNLTTALTGETFNFCLVNYYATGQDSISYHSDDERFLGPQPAIASFTLGARRDFLMRHKKVVPPLNSNSNSNSTSTSTHGGGGGDAKASGAGEGQGDPIKFSLGGGDMLLMRGETQANWLHSVPKRKGRDADKGRINITLRRAMVPGGTENYYRYNVGDGEVYRWDEKVREMVVWTEKKEEEEEGQRVDSTS